MLAQARGATQAWLAAADKPLLQAGKKSLYQRVLTTPSCRLGDQPGAAGGTSVITSYSIHYTKLYDFRDGFKVAGDDILLDVIRQFVLPAVREALSRAVV